MIITLSEDERKALKRADSSDEIFTGNSPSYWTITSERIGSIKTVYPEFRYSLGGPSIPAGLTDRDVVQGPLDLFAIEDAYLFPAFGVVISKDGLAFRSAMEEATYFSPDLTALPYIGRKSNGTEFVPPRDLPVIERGIVTFPWGALNNYGHFLLDCLSGVGATFDSSRKHRFPYVFPPLNAWQKRHLALCNIESAILDEPIYCVKKLVFTSCMAHFLHRPSAALRSIATLQKSALTMQEGQRKIYLSRRGNPKRHFVSETILETLLANHGFDIVMPETLSVDDQIRLFASAKVVVGDTGAAFANIIYCAPGALIVEAQPEGMHNVWVRNICALTDLRWAAYFCPSKFTNVAHPEVGMTFDYDTDDFLKFIYAAKES